MKRDIHKNMFITIKTKDYLVTSDILESNQDTDAFRDLVTVARKLNGMHYARGNGSRYQLAHLQADSSFHRSHLGEDLLPVIK